MQDVVRERGLVLLDDLVRDGEGRGVEVCVGRCGGQRRARAEEQALHAFGKVAFLAVRGRRPENPCSEVGEEAVVDWAEKRDDDEAKERGGRRPCR